MNKFKTGIEDLLWVGKRYLTRNAEFVKNGKPSIKVIKNLTTLSYKRLEYKLSEIFKDEEGMFELVYSADIKEGYHKDNYFRVGTYEIRKHKL